MRKKKITTKHIVFAAVVPVVLALVLVFVALSSEDAARGPDYGSYAMYSWEGEGFHEDERDTFLDTLEQLGVSTVYQEFPEDISDSDAELFLRDMERANVDVYYLTGRAEWGLESDGESLKREIDRAAALSDGIIKGLMVDVEPYLTDEWDEDKSAVMKSYVSGMAEAKSYAASKGMTMLACVPTWYDRRYSKELAYLVETGCDGLAVMNYDRTDEIGQIAAEVELCQKAGLPIICISELQAPGKHSLEEINTYYNLGFDALWASWSDISDGIDYSKLSFAYHWYHTALELLERDGNIAD